MLLYTSVNTTSIGRWSLSESVSVIVVAAEPVPYSHEKVTYVCDLGLYEAGVVVVLVTG